MSKRILEDFINAYMVYTADSEPPQSYHLWTCLSILAAALQRKVYMHWGRSTIRPNIYVVLVGPAGRTKKGTAMEFGKAITQGAGIKLVGGSVTREALIRRIAAANDNYTDGSTGKIEFHCSLTCISEELSVFLGQHNIKFLADLCDWYDCPPFWRYDTKNQGTDNLHGVCFNIIGATAPEWIPTMLPEAAIGGGFTRRIIWIVEEDKRATVIEPTYDEELERKLIHDLEFILVNITGEYTFSKNAFDRYADWYAREDRKISEGLPPIPDPKFAGYCDARATTIKKIAMLTSVSEGSERVIKLRHFDRALSLLESAESKMARAFRGLGQSRYVKATDLVLNFMVKRKKATTTQILRMFYRDIDLETLLVCLKTLEKLNVVGVTHPPATDYAIVELKEDLLDGLISQGSEQKDYHLQGEGMGDNPEDSTGIRLSGKGGQESA